MVKRINENLLHMEKVPVSATEAKSTKKQKVSSRGITHLIMVLEIKKDKKNCDGFLHMNKFHTGR